MQLPQVTKTMEISVTLSVFLGILYIVCWFNQKKNKSYLWFGMIFVCNALYAWVRILQLQGPAEDMVMVLSRTILGLLFMSCSMAYGFVWAVRQKKITRVSRGMLLSTQVIGQALIWSSNLILTDRHIQRTMLTGEGFTGLETGPLYSIFVLLLLGGMVFLAVTVYRSHEIPIHERRLMALGYMFILVFGLNDMVFTAFKLPTIRLLDLAFWPLGFLFTYIQFSRFSKWHEILEHQIKEKIGHLIDTNKNLEMSEKRYRELFEKGSDWIFVHDMAGMVTEHNLTFKKPSILKTNGLDPFNIQDLMSRQYQDGFYEYLARINKKGNDSGRFVLMTTHQEEIYLEYRNILFRDLGGNPVEVKVIARDVTQEVSSLAEKKRLEESLRQSQKMEAIGTMAAGIAHDFNNILGVIIGNAELALMDMNPMGNVWHSLGEIKTASLRGKEVVGQLLNFSRKTEKETELVNLNSIVEETAELIRASLPESITFIYNLPDTAHYIVADASQIHRVVLNLLANAVQSMEKNGGILEIFLEKNRGNNSQKLTKKGCLPGPYICLGVKDTGGGIDSKIQDRIFDPYFTTKTADKGTGMGLAIVHGIVKHHGGMVGVESFPGQGTCFKVLFPEAGLNT